MTRKIRDLCSKRLGNARCSFDLIECRLVHLSLLAVGLVLMLQGCGGGASDEVSEARSDAVQIAAVHARAKKWQRAGRHCAFKADTAATIVADPAALEYAPEQKKILALSKACVVGMLRKIQGANREISRLNAKLESYDADVLREAGISEGH